MYKVEINIGVWGDDETVTIETTDFSKVQILQEFIEFQQENDWTADYEQVILDEEDFEEDINSFLEELALLEKKLIETPNEQNIQNYRTSIGKFLKKVSKNYSSFEFYTKKRLRCKIWKVIDQELEELYRGVIKKNLNGLLLLNKLHEIKGLIIDLKIGDKK